MKKTSVPSIVAGMLMSAASVSSLADARTPVVVFPAFHLTTLEVKVHKQTAFPDCPASGSFEDWFPNPNPGTEFSQVCKDKLLTLVVDPDKNLPVSSRFSNQPGVKVKVKHYGDTESAPFYEPLYVFLEANGYARNQNIRVAGYDSRLTPDIGSFLEKTKELIEETYHQNQNTPVHLVGHSNGPLYIQYLLTHTTQEWKNRFIHGFTPLAGNWPGQGLLYPVYFTGLNIIDFTFPTDAANAASSAAMYQSHPSSYMSSADPAIFKDQETVLQVGDVSYTPEDHQQLFEDAHLPLSKELAAAYIGFVKFNEPQHFPNVDVYAEKGSGLDTLVGLGLPDLSVGQVVDFNSAPVFTRDGDGNQEDLTNDAAYVWQNMPCYHFELNDNAGVDHFGLASDTAVLNRLLTHLQQPKSVCPAS
ncbi:lipase/acyltransferase domain-containing protein [Methylobacter sp.]|uniref:lipase/acyltransferase domain-containing protein n=1 Tax=Methylobacter sp. TaxID=2051955 RepID=UPI003DA54505